MKKKEGDGNQVTEKFRAHRFVRFVLLIKASLNGNFMHDFMTLNIFTFADMARRENDGVL